MDVNERVALFRDMVSCCHDLYLWDYDCALHLLNSNCPEQEAMRNLLQLSITRDDFGQELIAQDTPLLIANEMSMMWLALPRFEERELLRNYLLGPFFTDDVSSQSVETLLVQHGLPQALREKMMELIRRLPVISWSRVQEYAIMLYHCITGGRISASDLRFYTKAEVLSAQLPEGQFDEKMDVHGTYQAEQEMLRMVRQGDLRLGEYIDRMALTGNLGRLSNGDPIRQVKNAILVCATLFSRAAIEGGLDPELSYTLTDRYFQAVEACNGYQELNEISRTMQDDYVQRVHRYRMSQYSHAVQQCCDYISLHLEEEITLDQLAKQIGYATYYLSKKFKKEVGSVPADYIRRQRLERAAFLLRTTHEDVQTISIRLQFGSQSYFSESFRKEYGMTPTEYRQQNT